MDFLARAQVVLRIEKEGLDELIQKLDSDFNKACELLLSAKGRVVVLGVGKSGHVGNKIAATLASTGTPAFFVHAAEACHGDFGMIQKNDVVMAISYSGKTPEIITLLPFIKALNVPLLSLTGSADSPLAKASDVHLDIHVREEACPLGLAPTTSTTVTLVLGDAVAVCLLEKRGFTKEQFAFSHPGGNLGKRLLLRVADVMRQKDAIPKVLKSASLHDTILEMTEKKLGMTTIVDQEDHLLGIFTDGDLRRVLQQHETDFQQLKIADVMNTSPKTISEERLASFALEMMEGHANKITALVVTNDANVVRGVAHLHDLLTAGL